MPSVSFQSNTLEHKALIRVDTGGTHFALVRPKPPLFTQEGRRKVVYTYGGVHFFDVSHTLEPHTSASETLLRLLCVRHVVLPDGTIARLRFDTARSTSGPNESSQRSVSAHGVREGVDVLCTADRTTLSERRGARLVIRGDRCEPLVQLRGLLETTRGVLGARFSGAGWRGCCVALVRADEAAAAAAAVAEGYAVIQVSVAEYDSRTLARKK